MSQCEMSRARVAVASVMLGLVLVFGQFAALAGEDGGRSQPAPVLPQKSFGDAEPCPVVRICRGDTLIVRMGPEAKRIGLIGVEVPGLTEAAGLAAEKFLENLLAGEAVFVEFADSNPTADRFGCIPAYLFRAPDGLFVNLELVRQGYAAVPEEATFAHRPLFEQFAQRARDAGKGRWGPQPAPDSQALAKETKPSSAPAAGSKAEGRKAEKPASPSPAAAAATPATAAQPAATADDTGADPIVYVTAKGAKYHRETCRHARKSGRPVTLSEARKLGLQPCSQCKPPD